MLEHTTGILFHILTGYNLGAKIVLPTGKHSIGTDNTCDIILEDADIAAYHAEITVTEKPLALDTEKREYAVTVTPLEGVIGIGNTAVTKETELAENDLMHFNSVYMLWQHEDSPVNLEQFYRKLYSETTQQENTPAQKNKQPQQKTENDTIDANNIGTEADSSNKSDKKKNVSLMLFFTVLICLAFILTFTPIKKSSFKNMQAIEKHLAENGFPTISATLADNTILFEGILNSNAEQARLYALAQTMQYPVHMNIMIKEDIENAFKNTLATEDIHPAVDIKNDTIHLSYYVKDAFIQQIAHKTLKEMLPSYLTEHVVYDTVLYADVLQKLIDSKKEEFGLENVYFGYDKGKVLISGANTLEQENTVANIFDAVSNELGFKIVYSLARNGKTKTQGTAQKKTKNSFEEKTKELNVKSVTMGAIPFITLDNDEKIFEGGMLPTGATLEKITLHELTLMENNSLTTYQLRGDL